MSSISGTKYKRYMILVNKDENETVNSYNKRLWFVVNNITKKCYTDLILLSKYYYNIYFKGMRYNPSIHAQLEQLV